MGFFDFGKPNIPVSSKVVNVKVSPLGLEKIKRGAAAGMEFDVLITVQRLEPCTPEEVAHGITPARAENKVRYTLRGLQNKGWIEVME
jgi:hypothetical protein